MLFSRPSAILRSMADAPEDLADIRRDLERGLGLIAKKAPDYELAREFYDGTRAEQASSKAAETIIRQAKDTAILRPYPR